MPSTQVKRICGCPARHEIKYDNIHIDYLKPGRGNVKNDVPFRFSKFYFLVVRFKENNLQLYEFSVISVFSARF